MIKEKYRANRVAHWDFRLGSLSDQSGNGWDIATTSGSPRFSSNKYGRALVFAGSERCTLGKVLGTTAGISALTVVVKLKPRVDTSMRRIFTKYLGSASAAGSIIFDMNVNAAGDFRWGFATSEGAWSFTTTAAGVLKDGKEQVIIATFDGATGDKNAFVNGAQVIDATFPEATIPALDQNWFLGEDAAVDAQQFLGEVNEMIVFNVGLSPQEASQLYDEMQQEAHYDLVDIQHLDNRQDMFDVAGADILDCYIADGRGWNESIANQTSGFLSNTGFVINTGTWKVSSRGTADGRKVLECVGNGQLQMTLMGVSGWTTNTFEQFAGTPSLTKNTDNIQIDAVAGDKIGIINLTDF